MTEIRNAKLRDLNVQAERAQARYEEGEKRLFRSDGSKLYSEDEHRRRVRALKQERSGVLTDIEEQAKEMQLVVASEVEHIENADPADKLTSEELERANQKRAFAVDAAETLDTEAFKKRLESVLAGGDRGTIFAYWMAGQRKREGIREQRRKALSEAGRSSTVAGSVTDLDEVLNEMEQTLDGGDRTAKVEAAKSREMEAFAVESLAHYLQIGARDAAQAYSKQTYGRLSRR